MCIANNGSLKILRSITVVRGGEYTHAKLAIIARV